MGTLAPKIAAQLNDMARKAQWTAQAVKNAMVRE
jgi:hypothetical protein